MRSQKSSVYCQGNCRHREVQCGEKEAQCGVPKDVQSEKL